jgi:hypothetical protein
MWPFASSESGANAVSRYAANRDAPEHDGDLAKFPGLKWDNPLAA